MFIKTNHYDLLNQTFQLRLGILILSSFILFHALMS